MIHPFRDDLGILVDLGDARKSSENFLTQLCNGDESS